MRFLVVADIHYALKQFDWLLDVAPHYDAVVIAGDLLEISHMVDRRAQIIVMRTYLSRIAESVENSYPNEGHPSGLVESHAA